MRWNDIWWKLRFRKEWNRYEPRWWTRLWAFGEWVWHAREDKGPPASTGEFCWERIVSMRDERGWQDLTEEKRNEYIAIAKNYHDRLLLMESKWLREWEEKIAVEADVFYDRWTLAMKLLPAGIKSWMGQRVGVREAGEKFCKERWRIEKRMHEELSKLTGREWPPPYEPSRELVKRNHQ